MALPRLILDLNNDVYADSFVSLVNEVAAASKARAKFQLLLPEDGKSLDGNSSDKPFVDAEILSNDIAAVMDVAKATKNGDCVCIVTKRLRHFEPLAQEANGLLAIKQIQDIREITKPFLENTLKELCKWESKEKGGDEPAEELLVKKVTQLCLDPANIPRTAESLACLIEAANESMKDKRATEEEEWTAFGLLLSEEYFVAPLLRLAIDKGLVASIKDAKDIGRVNPTEKLTRNASDIIEEEKMVGMNDFEANDATIVITEIAGRFVANFIAKGWKTIKKLESLRKHFRTQVETFAVIWFKKDEAGISFLVDKIIQVLERRHYLQQNGLTVVYFDDEFKKGQPLVLSQADLGIYVAKHGANPGSSSSIVRSEAKRKLNDTKVLLAQHMRDHFIAHCRKSNWFTVTKQGSLMTMLTTQIKSFSSPGLPNDHLDAIKASPELTNEVIYMALDSLLENGFISNYNAFVSYKPQRFDSYYSEPFKLLPCKVRGFPESVPKKADVPLCVSFKTPKGEEVKKKVNKVKSVRQDEDMGKEVMDRVKAMGKKAPTTVKELYDVVNEVINAGIHEEKEGIADEEQAAEIVKQLYRTEKVICTNPKLSGAEFSKPSSTAPIEFYF